MLGNDHHAHNAHGLKPWITFSAPVHLDDPLWVTLYEVKPWSPSGSIYLDMKGCGPNERFKFRTQILLDDDVRTLSHWDLSFSAPVAGSSLMLHANGVAITPSMLWITSWGTDPWGWEYQIAQVGGMEKEMRFTYTEFEL